MFVSRTLNNKINCLHERCFRIVCNNKKSTYENVLVRDRSVSVHIRNLQILAGKMFKLHRDLSPPIFKETFNKTTLNNKLQHLSQFTIPRVASVYNGFESVAFLGPKIRNMVPSKLKEISSMSCFKQAIKEWYARNCPCRLCRRYLGNIKHIHI